MFKFMIFLFFYFVNIETNCNFQSDWEHKQFSKSIFDDEYYENKILFQGSGGNFQSADEVIADARNVIESWKVKNSVPGVVIGLSIKGKDVWTEGFGYTDIENNVTTHKDSVWRLASISKPLTTALIGVLIDRKLVDLNKSINEYLPKNLLPVKTWNELPVNITLRQVLSHMGCFHLTKLPNDFEKVFEAKNVSQTLELLKNEKLLCKPGTEYSYSNYGYQVIGAIIESVLGNTYPNEMHEMFLKLGMNSTFAEKRETIVKHRPRYYANSNGNLVNVDLVDDLFSYEGWWPSGGMVSTVSDLLRFGNAMLSAYNGKQNSFMSQKTVKELWTPETIGIPKAQNTNGNEYAKGWFITHIAESVPYPYKTLIWHSGGLLGTSTILFIFPEQDIVGVAFANKGYVIGLDQIVLLVAKNFEFLL